MGEGMKRHVDIVVVAKNMLHQWFTPADMDWLEENGIHPTALAYTNHPFMHDLKKKDQDHGG